MFIVVVTEVSGSGRIIGPGEALELGVERYRQAVETLDLKKIIEAVNYKPRGPRAKKGAE